MITSRISSKAQTTLPKPVRTALGIRNGDEVVYEITGRTVLLSKAGERAEDPFAVFEEWASEADETAFAGF